MRWFLVGIVVFVAVVLVGIPSYLGPDDLKKCDQPVAGTCDAADAIVTVSGGDTIARTDEAIKLYHQGWAPLLVFSGAAADRSGPSNALAMKRYAVESGIPESVIVIEEFSQTTAENAVNTSLFLKSRQIDRIVLVTSAYHQRRAELEFSVRLGGTVTILNHPVRYDNQWSDTWWTTIGGWRLAFGELGKILVFFVNRGSVS
ncbi:YdcF family protein [Pedobacter sp.]|nr:YdcF family protein [Candidatus Saccharibacteria bacterium]